MSRALKILLAFALVAVLVVVAFGGGVVVGHIMPMSLDFIGVQTPDSPLGEKVEEVQQLIESGALEPSSEDSQTAGAISGLLESLDDPYAMYFDPEHFEYFNEQNDGEFFGIGVTISQREETVFVVSVIEDTPAEEVGLQADDEIVSIDGVKRERWDLDEVVSRIRGPEGTTVNVEVYRPDEERTFQFDITRARINIPNVMSRLEGENVGYVRLLNFNSQSVQDLREAIADLTSQGAEGFVLDLRDNPGGLLDASVDVASLFVEDGVIVRVETRENIVEEHRATGNTATDAPVVVLINNNSASASEIVAGALQDYDRATIVGETSFGKGSVQTVARLSFGGAIKYTMAHYLTPQGRTIDGVGVVPDVEVEMEPELQNEREQDTQMQRAIEEVQSQL